MNEELIRFNFKDYELNQRFTIILDTASVKIMSTDNKIITLVDSHDALVLRNISTTIALLLIDNYRPTDMPVFHLLKAISRMIYKANITNVSLN